jgi:hypothetical protein
MSERVTAILPNADQADEREFELPLGRADRIRAWARELIAVQATVTVVALVVAIIADVVVMLFAGGNASYRFGWGLRTFVGFIVAGAVADVGAFLICLWPSALTKKPRWWVALVAVPTLFMMVFTPFIYDLGATEPNKSCEQAARGAFRDIQGVLAQTGNNAGPFSYDDQEADYVHSACGYH